MGMQNVCMCVCVGGGGGHKAVHREEKVTFNFIH